MDKQEITQAQELQQMVDAWSAMNKYSFYVGTQRGILSSMNTICLRFAGMTFEDYTKAAFKPQLNQMMTVGQIMQLLGGLLKSIEELIALAMAEAKKEVEKEGEKNEKDTNSGTLAE